MNEVSLSLHHLFYLRFLEQSQIEFVWFNSCAARQQQPAEHNEYRPRTNFPAASKPHCSSVLLSEREPNCCQPLHAKLWSQHVLDQSQVTYSHLQQISTTSDQNSGIFVSRGFKVHFVATATQFYLDIRKDAR